MFALAHTCTSLHMFRCLGRPEEDSKSQGAIVVMNCEPPNMITGTQTQGLCKNGKSFLTAGSSLLPQGPEFSN